MSLKKWQKIFVNRSLNMASIKAIGFDMDHTLVVYNRENFEALAFAETLKKFIKAGYPEELSELRFDPQSVIRGLLVDRERGNLLKVDGHKYVKYAFHGKRALAKEERHKLYNAESFKAEKFLSVDSFFALSEVQLFTEIVDYMNRNPKKIKKNFKEVYADLRSFIDESHRDGSIKTEVVKAPERYIIRDKFLPEALLRMIDGGKELFLLTNSAWDYSDIVMSFILTDAHPDLQNWRDYFEYVIVGAGKPGFFTGSQPFYEVVPTTNLLKPYDGKLKTNLVYHGGNATLFQKLTGFHGDDILYAGDHIYGDIIRSKGLFNWRTMLIVEELNSELPRLEEASDSSDQILAQLKIKEQLDEDLQKLRSKSISLLRQIKLATERTDTKRATLLEKEQERNQEKFVAKEKEVQDLEKEVKELIERRDFSFHPSWGQLMKVGMEKSRFAHQVELYACIYTSRASNLRFYSPFKRFASPHDLLPHDL
jgi:5'-nucleotidase